MSRPSAQSFELLFGREPVLEQTCFFLFSEGAEVMVGPIFVSFYVYIYIFLHISPTFEVEIDGEGRGRTLRRPHALLGRGGRYSIATTVLSPPPPRPPDLSHKISLVNNEVMPMSCRGDASMTYVEQHFVPDGKNLVRFLAAPTTGTSRILLIMVAGAGRERDNTMFLADASHIPHALAPFVRQLFRRGAVAR